MMFRQLLQKKLSPILSKLHVPKGRKAVQRERLVKMLNQGVESKLTLISAPAGFGKTTLLIEWSRQANLPIAWVSLDSSDNDPLQFWLYFFTAIEYLYPDIGRHALTLIHRGGSRSIEGVLTYFVNEVDRFSAPLAIVLDDYHVVSTAEIHAGIVFLLEHLPDSIRMIVSSRTVPPFPLSRMRVRGEAVEIQSNSLRFTLDETAIFLKDIMNLDVPIDSIIALNESTNGWIAGLQVAALSMHGSKNIPEFVQNFSHSNRYIFNYLREEVIEKLPANIQSFLYMTSILDRLNAGLCEAVTGQPGSQEILAELEKDNLFIIHVDEDHYWYQYHQLLASTLRFQLEQQQPQQVSTLHEKAAQWFEANGFYVDAIKEYITAANYSSAASLLSQIGLDVMYQGELGLMLNWVEKLPREVINQHPSLLIYYAWCLISSEYHLEIAEECLKQADALLKQKYDHAADGEPLAIKAERTDLSTNSLRGAVYYLYSFLSRLRGDNVTAIDHAKVALGLLPDNDFVWRSFAAWNLAEAYRYRGDISQWGDALDEAIVASKAADKTGIKLLIIDNLAELQYVQGQLHQAEKTWNQALVYADEKLEGKRSLLACTIYSGLGLLYYEWNRLDIAKQHLLTALEIAKLGGIIEISLESSISLGRLLVQQGERAAGMKLLYDLEPVIRAREETKHAIRARAYIAFWEYMQGNKEHFYNWVQTRKLSLEDTPQYINESAYWILCRIMIREGVYEDVLKLLKRMEETGRASGRMLTELKSLVLQAGLHERHGETTKAFIPLQQALTLAEPGGFVRTFIEASSYMFGLLNKYAARYPDHDYVNRLLSEFEGFTRKPTPVQKQIEPLSERELEVLQLIAARLTSREIAVALNISVNTARTHIKNIYSKLDAHNYKEAALRAEALGLSRGHRGDELT